MYSLIWRNALLTIQTLKICPLNESKDINSQDPVMVEVKTGPLQFSNHTIIFIPLPTDHL